MIRVRRIGAVAALLILMALCGLLCLGALLGVAIGMNPYIGSTIVMGIWILGLTYLVAFAEAEVVRTSASNHSRQPGEPG